MEFAMAMSGQTFFSPAIPPAGAVRRRGRRRAARPTVTSTMAQAALADRVSEACAAAWRAVDPQTLRNATRSTARVAIARQAAIYFSHVFFGANLTRAARVFGRDRTTARHACSRMEDMREDRRIDRAFDVIEPALHLWLQSFSTEIRR